ncbi:MAG: hypothetical protein AB1665_01635 [Candidatus Thermoplasmatota archaeon]
MEILREEEMGSKISGLLNTYRELSESGKKLSTISEALEEASSHG